MWGYIEELFGDQRLKGHFVVRAKKVFQDGERVFDAPHTADAWNAMQAEAEEVVVARGGDPAKVGIAALQVSSDKTDLNRKGESGYPLRMTLANISFARRFDNAPIAALLPTFYKTEKPAWCKDTDMWANVRPGEGGSFIACSWGAERA